MHDDDGGSDEQIFCNAFLAARRGSSSSSSPSRTRILSPDMICDIQRRKYSQSGIHEITLNDFQRHSFDDDVYSYRIIEIIDGESFPINSKCVLEAHGNSSK